MKKKTISFLVHVHTLPKDLEKALEEQEDHLYETAQIYQKLVASDLLWKVWQQDEYGSLWLEVNFINAIGKAEFHTLKIDEGTFTRIECSDYEIL